MKRRFGMWIGIILILMIGVSVTRLTRNFVISKGVAASSILNVADAANFGAVSGGGAASESEAEIQLEIPMAAAEMAAVTVREEQAEVPAGGSDLTERATEEPYVSLDEPALEANEIVAEETVEDSLESVEDPVVKHEPVAGMTGGPGAENYDTETIVSEPVGPGAANDMVMDRKVTSRKPAAVQKDMRTESVKSPLDPVVEIETVDEEVQEQEPFLAAEDFFERFRMAEESSVKIWEKITADNIVAYNAAAEQERVLWDYELNLIYSEIRSRMPDEEAENLKHLELEWLKERDQYAEKIAAKSSMMNGQKNDPAYIRALAEKTKERCYWLVAEYEDVLNREKIEDKKK